jgi:hypothetical protein
MDFVGQFVWFINDIFEIEVGVFELVDEGGGGVFRLI